MADADWFAELGKALDDFLRTRELEEGRELPPEAPSLEDRRAELNEKYWVFVRQLVNAALPEKFEQGMQLSDDAKSLLDFGVFPHPTLDKLRKRLDTGAQVHGVVLLSESLSAALAGLLRKDTIDSYRDEVSALSNDISLWPDTHLVHIHYRDAKVGELLGDTPRASHVLRLFSEVDEKLEQYKRLQARDADGGLSKDEKKSWATIRHFVESRQKEINSILTPLSAEHDPESSVIAGAALAASEAVEASVAHLIELHDKQRDLEGRILEQESSARRVSRQEAEKALSRELSAVAGLLRLAARYVHLSECAVPVDEAIEFIDANRAADTMERMLQFDRNLLSNPLAARFGTPDLLLAPGIGDGVFDASRNRWVVPQRCRRSAAESLAHAAILYRLEVDSGEMNKALIASYRESIPANRNVRANLKLRTNLIRDYIKWMTLETYGEEVLSRDTREWFERHIAPSKTEPWQPPEYRNLNKHQLKVKLQELARTPESVTREFRIGVIEWLLDPSEDAIRERSLPAILRGLKLDNAHQGAVYSAAVLHMRLGQHQKAIAAFRRFTELAPGSWWSRKAIELCARCR